MLIKIQAKLALAQTKDSTVYKIYKMKTKEETHTYEHLFFVYNIHFPHVNNGMEVCVALFTSTSCLIEK